MLPIISIYGITLPSYGLMIVLGVIVGLLVIIKFFSKYYTISKEDIIYALIYGLIGAIIGSKILYLLTNIKLLLNNIDNIVQILLGMLSGGFVFYGGLIGGVLGVYIYSKQFKVSFKELVMLIVPTLPLMHAFGRIGCLLAGCCYGVEYHGIGHIIFNNSMLAPNGVPLFPMQIVESICNIIIFCILLVTYKRNVGTYKSIVMYFSMYSITRFILEFFRGDLVRGNFLFFSTSQWISIVILIVTIYFYYNDIIKLNNKKNNSNTKVHSKY